MWSTGEQAVTSWGGADVRWQGLVRRYRCSCPTVNGGVPADDAVCDPARAELCVVLWAPPPTVPPDKGKQLPTLTPWRRVANPGVRKLSEVLTSFLAIGKSPRAKELP